MCSLVSGVSWLKVKVSFSIQCSIKWKRYVTFYSNILKLHLQGLSGVCQKMHSSVFSADDQFLKTNTNDEQSWRPSSIDKHQRTIRQKVWHGIVFLRQTAFVHQHLVLIELNGLWVRQNVFIALWLIKYLLRVTLWKYWHPSCAWVTCCWCCCFCAE